MQKWLVGVASVLFILIACDRGDLKARSSDTPEKLYYTAPTQIPYTSIDMKNAGFWISRHPYPDRVILNSKSIEALNNLILLDQKLLTAVATMASFKGDELRIKLGEGLGQLKEKKWFDSAGDSAGDEFFKRMERGIDLKSIPKEVEIRHGIVTSNTAVRHFPTDEPMYEEKGDVNFDELQNDTLSVGVPVAILHKSADGRWLFVEATASHGWLRRESVAIATVDKLGMFSGDAGRPAVVISPKAEIYLSPALKEYHSYIMMGDVLPFKTLIAPGVAEVLLPVRSKSGTLEVKSAYMEREDINEGFLPYTPRIIIKQAFVMLNSPYGWGGMYGEQDCSRMLQMLFGVVGIHLPRDSSKQREVGQLIGRFEKQTSESAKHEALVRDGVPGITLLQMKGHIVLYLGEVNGRFYVIHDTWGYREPDEHGEDRLRAINRVAVTDLSLGEGSKKGSLLERILTMRVVR